MDARVGLSLTEVETEAQGVCDGWTMAGGALVPGRGQSVDVADGGGS